MWQQLDEEKRTRQHDQQRLRPLKIKKKRGNFEVRQQNDLILKDLHT
jgi:hypothetical protein